MVIRSVQRKISRYSLWPGRAWGEQQIDKIDKMRSLILFSFSITIIFVFFIESLTMRLNNIIVYKMYLSCEWLLIIFLFIHWWRDYSDVLSWSFVPVITRFSNKISIHCALENEKILQYHSIHFNII